MNGSTPPPSRVPLTALFLVGAANGAVAQDPKPVHYTCADGQSFRPSSLAKHLNGISEARLCRTLDRDDAPTGSFCGWSAIRKATSNSGSKGRSNSDPSGKINNLPYRQLIDTFRLASPTPA
jgi:hypothetical protein